MGWVGGGEGAAAPAAAAASQSREPPPPPQRAGQRGAAARRVAPTRGGRGTDRGSPHATRGRDPPSCQTTRQRMEVRGPGGRGVPAVPSPPSGRFTSCRGAAAAPPPGAARRAGEQRGRASGPLQRRSWTRQGGGVGRRRAAAAGRRRARLRPRPHHVLRRHHTAFTDAQLMPRVGRGHVRCGCQHPPRICDPQTQPVFHWGQVAIDSDLVGCCDQRTRACAATCAPLHCVPEEMYMEMH